MSTRTRILTLSELGPGEMRALDIEDLPPLAAFNVDGRICVTSNVCTHNVATLTDGYFEGEIVECPLHGGCFNVTTGLPTQFPCVQPLQIYPVMVEHGVVYLEDPRVEVLP